MRRRGLPFSGWVVMLVGGLYFVVPLAATVQFSLQQGNAGYGVDAYRQILEDPQFRDTLWFSVQLALETTVLTMLLMLPTVYWLHLRLPRVRPAAEFVSVLPLVTPPIVLVVGLFGVWRGRLPDSFVFSPKFLVAAYVIVCLPFVYRALDAGMRAVDIHTLTEAAQSLGAGRARTLFRVILPNLRGAITIACLLTFVIVMGEYTIASIALYQTFPVYITYVGTALAYQAAALSIISVLITFLAALVFVVLGRLGSPGSSREARREGRRALGFGRGGEATPIGTASGSG
jgi:putative spermidine/putrescine transport system permease protein